MTVTISCELRKSVSGRSSTTRASIAAPSWSTPSSRRVSRPSSGSGLTMNCRSSLMARRVPRPCPGFQNPAFGSRSRPCSAILVRQALESPAHDPQEIPGRAAAAEAGGGGCRRPQPHVGRPLRRIARRGDGGDQRVGRLRPQTLRGGHRGLRQPTSPCWRSRGSCRRRTPTRSRTACTGCRTRSRPAASPSTARWKTST